MPPGWRRELTSPLLRMLGLSLSLHVALVLLVQPAPGGGGPVTRVIQARLTPPATPVAPPDPLPISPPETPESPAMAEPPVLEPNPSPPPAPPAPDPIEMQPASTPVPTDDASSIGTMADASPPEAPSPASQNAEASGDGLPQIPVMLDTRWYTAREVDVHPKARSRIQFDYPQSAREQGVQGWVRVMLKVDEFGQVRDLEVVEGNPPGVFEESVRAAFSQALFEAARRDGVPVRALMQIRVTFELD